MMFKMYLHRFHAPHRTLVDVYNLKSTWEMGSVEAHVMFLWMVEGPQLVSQAEHRFNRSTKTIHLKLEELLHCLVFLVTDNIKQRDP